MKRVPKFISYQYGSSHEFRKSKRQIMRMILKEISDLRHGCSWFPSGSKDVEELAKIAKRIQADISVKNWGR